MVSGVKVATQRADGLEKAALRGLSDSLRDRLGSGVVVLASETDGKVTVVVSVTKDLTSRVQAGRLVRELAPIVGGGGGGRPDFAEAGGKDAVENPGPAEGRAGRVAEAARLTPSELRETVPFRNTFGRPVLVSR